MAHLVNTMVSYAITYKNKKIDPLPNKLKFEVATDKDTPVLSFDPPIADFVNFEVRVLTFDFFFFIIKSKLKLYI